MDRFSILNIFIRIADTASFTKAAETLSLPRSTVSSAIKQLEKQLQVRLFNRTTRSVHLTMEGEQLLERARSVVADIDNIEQLFLSNNSSLQGRLRVNVPSRISTNIIAPALPDFFMRYPEIRLELGATDRNVELISEGVDCAIRVGLLDDSRLIAKNLGYFQVTTCASPRYLSTLGTPKTIADLDEHQTVHYFSSNNTDSSLDFYIHGEEHTFQLKGSVGVDNADSYIACALSGMGIIQVPSFDIKKHLENGELIEILPQYQAPPMPIHALYPHRKYQSAKLMVFIDWVKAQFSQNSIAASAAR